ncbi:MAG TPA: hypothetical protein VEI58_04110 [Chthoniobacterales bacterium]|nr:hypothetical protein [Chthoniobacterales bacterium]
MKIILAQQFGLSFRVCDSIRLSSSLLLIGVTILGEFVHNRSIHREMRLFRWHKACGIEEGK